MIRQSRQQQIMAQHRIYESIEITRQSIAMRNGASRRESQHSIYTKINQDIICSAARPLARQRPAKQIFVLRITAQNFLQITKNDHGIARRRRSKRAATRQITAQSFTRLRTLRGHARHSGVMHDESQQGTF